MDENIFRIELQNDYAFKIVIGTPERIELLEALRKSHATYEKLRSWWENASPEDQEKYRNHYENLRGTISGLAYLCSLAGIDDDEINKYINVPF